MTRGALLVLCEASWHLLSSAQMCTVDDPMTLMHASCLGHVTLVQLASVQLTARAQSTGCTMVLEFE